MLELLETGFVKSATLVCREGMTQWVPLDDTELASGPGAHSAVSARRVAEPPADAAEWHYADAQGKSQGPLTRAMMAQLARSGEINSSTLVWKEGMREWTPMSAVPELPEVVRRQPAVAEAPRPIGEKMQDTSSAATSCPKCGSSVAAGAKFCVGCGAPVASVVSPTSVFCPNCGAKNSGGTRFCTGCGKPLEAGTMSAPTSGAPTAGVAPAGEAKESKRILAGVLALFLGAFGVHKFILGHTRAGLMMIGGTVGGWIACVVLTVILGIMTCGIGAPIGWLIGIAISLGTWCIGITEGIIYLTKSDAEFERIYVQGHKQWF
jgi:TM2 domain-containing membrane protein YozV/predicted RNA-binding Zn-ribbon protein involved in translation (DUF1610 family)